MVAFGTDTLAAMAGACPNHEPRGGESNWEKTDNVIGVNDSNSDGEDGGCWFCGNASWAMSSGYPNALVVF
ncbi:MAG: hypothetical protein WC058_01245 [Phycisphaeraceae bacterium]